MTEQELACVKAARRQRTGGFEELFKMYYKRVYVLAKSKLRNDAEAEDVSQQTFVTVWNNLHTLREPEAFAGWLTRITLNNCNTVLRKRSKVANIDGDAEELLAAMPQTDESLLPEHHAEQADLSNRLGDVVNTLSEEQREAVVLYYYHQLSVNEIAEATQVGNNTVKSRLSQARKHIKRKLEAEETRTGARFFSVGGLTMATLGAALAEQFATLEPLSEGVDAAYTQFSETIAASDASSASLLGGLGVGAESGEGRSYVNEYVAEMHLIAAIELPMAPRANAWLQEGAQGVKSEDGNDSLSLENYLEPLRAYAARLSSIEKQLTATGEELLEKLHLHL